LTLVTALKATLEGLCYFGKAGFLKRASVDGNFRSVAKDARSLERLSDLRLATVCLIAFAGFLHSEELINL